MSELIVVEEAAEGVRYVTLNRPEKKNAISTALRTALFETLQAHDHDDDVRVSIVRGAGDCFSSGYDLSSPLMDDTPYHSAPGDGAWARQATDGWFSIWDLAKPVIAQVHGYAMAGATELASACDLVYVAADAQISYPVVRVASSPDWAYHEPLLGLRHAMEAMLTGDAIVGDEAARIGWANRAYGAGDRGTHRGRRFGPHPDQEAARASPVRCPGRACSDAIGPGVPGVGRAPGLGPGIPGRPLGRHEARQPRRRLTLPPRPVQATDRRSRRRFHCFSCFLLLFDALSVSVTNHEKHGSA